MEFEGTIPHKIYFDGQTLKTAKVLHLPTGVFPRSIVCCYTRSNKTNIYMQTNENLVGFLKDNPNSNKETISNGTGLKGLALFNLLKKLQKEEQITANGDGDDVTYSLVEETTDAEQTDVEEISGVVTDTITEKQAKVEQTEVTDAATNESATNEQTEVTKKKSAGRDNSKFTFNGEAYGKGPLVRAVVAQYVRDNPTVTYNELKKVFPDTLLKRFGIFQDEKTAHEIAGKGNRYFFKDEHVIKLTDKNIVVCNQFTFDNLQPFLKVARELGYKID